MHNNAQFLKIGNKRFKHLSDLAVKGLILAQFSSLTQQVHSLAKYVILKNPYLFFLWNKHIGNGQ